jgi:hypothetical protein
VRLYALCIKLSTSVTQVRLTQSVWGIWIISFDFYPHHLRLHFHLVFGGEDKSVAERFFNTVQRSSKLRIRTGAE